MGYFKDRSHSKQKANRNLLIYLLLVALAAALYAYLSYLETYGGDQTKESKSALVVVERERSAILFSNDH